MEGLSNKITEKTKNLDMRDEIVELAEAYGYVLITPNKNPHMISFYKEESFDFRVNVYYTNMTVQVQYKDGKFKIEKGLTLSTLEDLLSNL
jgi:hypothetical protein